jgi:hypothetical protein
VPWDIFSPPPYCPDVAPSDFNLFTHLKQFLSDMCIGSDEEVKKTVKAWFNRLMADFYDAGIQVILKGSDNGV